MAGGTRSLCKTFSRKRSFSPSELLAGNLRRCLNRWDLTGLGVGSTLGVGTYVLLGYVAYNLAGPSVVLSFLIAAVAALLAGLCYAEMGSRIPRAGSAYIYTYVTMGELAAFVVGWNNILEGLFSTASIAKGLSLCLDSMTSSSISGWLTSVAPVSVDFFSPYFDLLAFCAVLFIGVLLCIGVKESSVVNNLLTAFNIIVIGFVIIAGAVNADSANWYIASTDVPEGHGSGGFFPYGMWGTLRGAAVCFYGFVGFDIITAAGEETVNPRENVPISILINLVTVFFAYSGVAIVVTMMAPYYLQDSISSVAEAFSLVGWDWAWWIVSIGTVCGITASLYGALFPVPRLLYAMSADGLLVKFLAKVSGHKSPVIATLIAATVIAVLSSVMVLEQLMMMMCLGTLISYTAVAACVILLRYRSDDPFGKSTFSTIFGCGLKAPTRLTIRVVIVILLLFIAISVSAALVLLYATNVLIPVLVLDALALLLVFIMCCQPKVEEDFAPKTPLVPLIPCLSIYVNIHLMSLINVHTWIRFGVWIIIGVAVYIIRVCCCRKSENNLDQNIKNFAHVDINGKSPVKIVVESPTPPSRTKRISDFGAIISNMDEMQEIKPQDLDEISEESDEKPDKIEEIIVQHAVMENNGEKEAKIIDLLDQVLQAEEDRYGAVIHLKEEDEDTGLADKDPVVHRKSLSELSDAGSDASFGNQDSSKYDVIAEVHREDLPIVNEEEERNDKEEDCVETIEIEEYEQVTAFNESETNSRTDESGYSDTILDKTGLNDSAENVQEDIPYIPPPPPIDEEYFARPALHKYYSMPKGKTKKFTVPPVEPEEEVLPPRVSIQSHGSQGDGNMVFGSDRQITFMSKLSGIFANKLNVNEDEQEQRKRSNSTGNVVDRELAAVARPLIFLELNKEFLEKKDKDLRPVKVEEEKIKEPEEALTEEAEDLSMTRKDLKSKLESIFASGGTQLMKPRLMKSNPPTPEEGQTQTSSTESIPKITKENKNDTLSRQRAKFGEVLNSFRLSMNSDDVV